MKESSVAVVVVINLSPLVVFVVLVRRVFIDRCEMRRHRLGALATDAAGELDVLGHDGHALGVDGTQVGVLEESDEVRLGSLLKRQHGVALEAEIGLRIVGMGTRLKFSQRKDSRGHTV